MKSEGLMTMVKLQQEENLSDVSSTAHKGLIQGMKINFFNQF